MNKWKFWVPSRASQVALVVKNLPAKAGNVKDEGSIPRSGRSPGGGHSNPLQCSCLENSMDRGAWWATAHRVAKNQTRQKELNTHTHTLQVAQCSATQEEAVSWEGRDQRGIPGRGLTIGLPKAWSTSCWHSVVKFSWCSLSSRRGLIVWMPPLSHQSSHTWMSWVSVLGKQQWAGEAFLPCSYHSFPEEKCLIA